MNALEDIRDMIYAELECFSQEEISKSNLDIIDKLTHSLKSIETIIAMNSYDGYDDNNSRRSGMRYDDGNSYRGSMRGGNRYYRSGMNGNGGGNSRNSYRGNGRYSREDGKEKILEKLEDYMETTDSDRVRDSIQKVINQIEAED